MNVLLDMDGVLVDFIKGACEAHKKENPYLNPINHGNYWIDWGMSDTEFWQLFDESFWENLDWMPDGQEILSIVENSFGAKNICLVTNPSHCDLAAAGKIRWIRKNMPNYLDRFLIGSGKYFCNGFLIDDYDLNIQKHKYSGSGLLLPRLWNSNFKLNTINYLVQEINSLIKDINYLENYHHGI